MLRNSLILVFIFVMITTGFFLCKGRDKNEDSQIDLDKVLLGDDYLNLLASNLLIGNPRKDGIPAVDNPEYESREKGEEWLQDEDVVFGVIEDDFVVAFPQRILVWHEIANIEIAGEKKSVTYCPLTGTAIGYKQSGTHDNKSFGVSGKLVNSNLVMYDRQTDSYWPQIAGQAVTGDLIEERLEEFPVLWTTWKKWKEKYPNTKVLARETGFFRDYGEGGDPYGNYLSQDQGYYDSTDIFFAPISRDPRLGPKDIVIGIRDQERNAIAVSKDVLRKKGEMILDLAGERIQLTYNLELDAHEASWVESGEWINSIDAMWFAWSAYYPETELILE